MYLYKLRILSEKMKSILFFKIDKTFNNEIRNEQTLNFGVFKPHSSKTFTKKGTLICNDSQF